MPFLSPLLVPVLCQVGLNGVCFLPSPEMGSERDVQVNDWRLEPETQNLCGKWLDSDWSDSS